MSDSYYTSTNLAEVLVSYIDKKNINTIADFCVGGGELLRTAKSKWKDAEIFGSDISNDAISILKDRYPDWNVEYCDFISEDSRASCKILRNRKFDLILLNPPFTCKGSKIHKTEFEGVKYNVSTAMLFLLESIKYLTPNGVLCSILPISVAYSQKDSKIWSVLEKKFNLTILEERDKQYFKNCYPPNIIIVSLNDFSKKKKQVLKKCSELSPKIESIKRGQLSVCDIIIDKRSPHFFIHSTNLRNNQIVDISLKVSNNYPLIVGPGVIIHRVGNPKPSKVCTFIESDGYIISDCLIFIKTKTHLDATKLKDYIISNWSAFEKLYKGTGAKYITLSRLRDFFSCNIIDFPLIDNKKIQNAGFFMMDSKF